MKDKSNTNASHHSKDKSEKDPNAPKITQDQAGPKDEKVDLPQKPQTLEAAKGNDEVMSQPSQPTPAATPRIDSHLKLARHETAQEEVHEVMTKHEAKKLTSKKSKK